MWNAKVGRQQFTELLQRGSPAESLRAREGGDRDGLKMGDVLLIWAKEPRNGELPVALMVRDADVDDFFAWTNTYVPNWSPISAYFRVFSDEEVIGNDDRISREGERLLEAASIGLVVTEAMAQSSEGYDVDRVSMSACIATFSYAASQGIRRKVDMTQLARGWSNCRSITGQAPLRIEVESLLVPWETVMDMINGPAEESDRRSKRGGNRSLVAGLREVVDKGEIGEATWKRLTSGFPNARQAIEPMKGTQEDRVTVLEHVLGDRGNWGYRYKEEYSFVAGYLGSRIFPGTIKHAGLILKHLERYPSAVVWLGLFAGLHGKRELCLSSLGRHVWRALTEEDSILSRPRCDIGIRELRVLFEGGMFGAQFRTVTPGRLVVELHPCVNAVVRWPAHDMAREARRQGELFASRSNEIGGVVTDLKEVRKGLDDAIRKLERWVHR